jgi:hypothetical protein
LQALARCYEGPTEDSTGAGAYRSAEFGCFVGLRGQCNAGRVQMSRGSTCFTRHWFTPLGGHGVPRPTKMALKFEKEVLGMPYTQQGVSGGAQGRSGIFSMALRQTCQLVCSILLIVRNQQASNFSRNRNHFFNQTTRWALTDHSPSFHSESHPTFRWVFALVALPLFHGQE